MPDTDFTVTNGQVEYEHKKPKAEYENATPKVTLSFTVADGADPVIVTKKVMGIAIGVVEQALNVKLVPEQPVIVPDDKPARQKKEPVVVERPKEPEPTPEPEKVDDEADLGIEPVKAEVITDADLQSQAQRTSASLKAKFGNINKLRTLINEHGGDGHLLQIPADQRKLFVEKAKGLAASE